MNERDGLYLRHILAAITDIESFMLTQDRDGFLADRKTQSAVIRQLEIIGEAVKKLSPELTGSQTGVPWRQIAGMRDRLIHAYFQVDLEAVWSTTLHDLPALRDQLRAMAAAQGTPFLPD